MNHSIDFDGVNQKVEMVGGRRQDGANSASCNPTMTFP